MDVILEETKSSDGFAGNLSHIQINNLLISLIYPLWDCY
jgi:hypothetical protein